MNNFPPKLEHLHILVCRVLLYNYAKIFFCGKTIVTSSKIIKKNWLFIFLKIFYLFIFRERGRRGRERERERQTSMYERNINRLPQLGLQPGKCPHWEWSHYLSICSNDAQPTEPHLSGPILFLL